MLHMLIINVLLADSGVQVDLLLSISFSMFFFSVSSLKIYRSYGTNVDIQLWDGLDYRFNQWNRHK